MTTPHYRPPLNGRPPAGHPYYQRPPAPPTHPMQNMWVHGHGPAVPPPYRPTMPTAPAPVERKRNVEAIVSVSLAAVGLLLSTIPLLRAMFGVAAVTLGVIGDVKARRRQGKQSRLGLLGSLIGVLEITAWLFSSP